MRAAIVTHDRSYDPNVGSANRINERGSLFAGVLTPPKELTLWCLLWAPRDDDVLTTLEVVLTAFAGRNLFDFLARREKRIDVTLNCLA